MLTVLSITSPIFLIVAIGFVAVRAGLFSKADIAVMGKFVLNFALPALLFTAVSERSLSEVANIGYLLAYGLGSVIVMIIAIALAMSVGRQPLAAATMRGMGSSMANSAFIGYPLLLQFLGPVAGLATAMSMLVENIILFPLVFLLAEAGIGMRGDSRGENTVVAKAVFGRVVKNPLLIAIALGAGFSIAGASLPDFASRSIHMLANASAAVALFVIGGTLVGLSIKGIRSQLIYVTVAKLVVHPIVVFLLLLVLPPLDRDLAIAVVAISSAPIVSIYPIIGQKYGEEGFCAAALLSTTVASFFTISLVLWAIESGLLWFPG